MLFSLWIGCVVAETCEDGSKSACAPMLAKPGNSWFETAGSRVVGISEWDRIVLDKSGRRRLARWWILVFSGS